MSRLKKSSDPSESTPLFRILTAADKTNASVFFLVGGDEGAAMNLAAFSNATDLEMIDWIKGGKSMAEEGNFYKGKDTYFESRASNPLWRSALRDAVASAKQEKAPAAQWKAIIEKMPGVKREELEFTGVFDWLDGLSETKRPRLNGGSVTKDQVIAFLDANGVQVKEVVRGGDPLEGIVPIRWSEVPDDDRRVVPGYTYIDEDDWVFKNRNGKLSNLPSVPADEAENESAAMDWLRDSADPDSAVEADGQTKYGKYQLPGGKNYRELLLTLPVDASGNFDKIAKDEYGVDSYFNLTDEQKERVGGIARGREAKNGGENTYRSSHWDEPNVLAHIRFNERTGANGERVLHIEEIQSDWHQEGRKKGYATKDSDRKATTATRQEGYWEVRDQNGDFVTNVMDYALPDADEAKVIEVANARLASQQGVANQQRVPDAPFKDTSAWSMLAMKRMIRYAAENGYDTITWTGGEAQAERYDLSKHISEVRAKKNSDGTWDISADSMDGETVMSDGRASDSDIEEMVGKELAEKIIKKGGGDFSGIDLKVGGKGMVGFYDKILPAETGKLLKKYGGKVERIGADSGNGQWYSAWKGGDIIDASRPLDTKEEAESDAAEWADQTGDDTEVVFRAERGEFQGFRITPQLRAAAEAGMPLFRRGGEARQSMGGVDLSALSSAIAEAALQLPGIRSEAVTSIDDLPGRIIYQINTRASRGEVDPSRIEGVFDPVTGRTFVIAENLHSVQRGIEVALHEDFGHYGPRLLLGDRHESVMLEIEKSFRGRDDFEAVRKDYKLIGNLSREARAKAADEYVARLAENGVLAMMAKQRPLGPIGRFFRAIREALQRIGLVKWTDADIERLIARGADAVNRQRAAEAGDGSASLAVREDDDGPSGGPGGGPRFSRRGWDSSFPDAVLGMGAFTAQSHPDYTAAKAGDEKAALRLARDLVSDDYVARIKEALGGKKPIIVPVLAIEAAGKNRIPLMVAHFLGERLGLPVTEDIVQSEKVSRGGSTGFHRLATKAGFSGPVKPGDYLILDDTLTQGGTLAELKTHIEDAGGRVVLASALTGKQYSRKLALSPETLGQLRERFGSIENWWRDEFGHDFSGLTESEGRFLLKLKGSPEPDAVRDRIIAARNESLRGMGARDDSNGQDQGSVGPSYSLSRDASTEARSDRAAYDEVVGDIRNTHAMPESAGMVDRIRSAVSAITGVNWLAAKQGMVDSFASIAALETHINGTLLDASDSAYKAAMMTKNLSGVMATIINHKQIKFDGKWFGIDDGSESFSSIFSPLAKEPGLLRLWEHWAGAVRAQRLMREGREKNYSQEEIDRVLAFVDERPALKRLFNDTHRRWREFNKRTLDMAEAAGVIDPAERALWENDDYVPFYRVIEETEDQLKGPLNRRGLQGQSSGIKRLKGGEGKVNIFESMVMNTMHLVDASMKNVAMQKVVDLADGVAMEKAEMEWKPVSLTDAQLAAALRKHGIAVESMDAQQRAAWSKILTRTIPQGRDIVSVMRNGKREYYRVTDPLLLRAVTAMGPEPLKAWLEILGMPKHVLTTMVTADPGFMAANFLRDTLSTWVTVKPTGLPQEYQKRVLVDAVRGGVRSFRNTADQWSLMAAGATGEGFYRTHPADVRKQMRELEALPGTLSTPAKAWRFWQRIGRTFENANRLAVYENVRKAGGSEAEAAYQAMDVLNFSRRGEWEAVRILTAVVPFLNARIQGLDRLYRGAKENRAAFAMKGAVLMAATLALVAAHEDDDRYWDLPEWDRDTYWHFWVGSEHFRIPKPFEVGILFGTIWERIWGVANGMEGARETQQAASRMIMGTLAFNPIPQAFLPMAEVAANWSVFGQRPVVNPFMAQYQAPEQQYDPWTSETMRALAEAMPDAAPAELRSPKNLEHMVRGYFGTLGTYVLGAADSAARWLGDFPDRPSSTPSQTPLVSRFWRQGETATRYPDKFYEMLVESNQAYGKVESLYKQGLKQEADQALADSRGQIVSRAGLNKVQQAMSKYSKEIRRVYADPDMSPNEKRDQIMDLQTKRNELAKQAVEQYWRNF